MEWTDPNNSVHCHYGDMTYNSSPLFGPNHHNTAAESQDALLWTQLFACSSVARRSHTLTYWIWIRQWAQWGRQKRNVVVVERKRLGSGSLSRAWMDGVIAVSYKPRQQNESYFQKTLSHFNLCCYSLSFLSHPLGGFLQQHFYFHLFISGQTLLLWLLETLYVLLCQADEACQSCMYIIHLAFSPDVSGECMIEH
jgi:hypothetical protein